MKKVEQYYLFDISKKLYCSGDGNFVKINECGISSYKKRHVASRIKERDYPFYNSKRFFVEIKEDGSKIILQKDDEI